MCACVCCCGSMFGHPDAETTHTHTTTPEYRVASVKLPHVTEWSVRRRSAKRRRLFGCVAVGRDTIRMSLAAIRVQRACCTITLEFTPKNKNGRKGRGLSQRSFESSSCLSSPPRLLTFARLCHRNNARISLASQEPNR